VGGTAMQVFTHVHAGGFGQFYGSSSYSGFCKCSSIQANFDADFPELTYNLSMYHDAVFVFVELFILFKTNSCTPF
jgi:hypothetical protein